MTHIYEHVCSPLNISYLQHPKDVQDPILPRENMGHCPIRLTGKPRRPAAMTYGRLEIEVE